METPRLAIDPEDFGLDIIPAIEKSFGFEFTSADLAEVRTYGALCGAVHAKLPSLAATDCTTQQAFYKLRQAICLHAGTQVITPATELAAVLPRQWARRQAVAAAIEQSLGMELHLVDMSAAVLIAGVLGLVLAFPIALLSNFLLGGAAGVLIGLGCFASAIMVFKLGSHFRATLRYPTVRELVVAMSTQHYRQSRRNPTNVNLREIDSRLAQLFVDMAVVKLAELTPDAVLMSA